MAIIETHLYVEYTEHVQEDADDPLSPIQSLTPAFTRLANSNSYPCLRRGGETPPGRPGPISDGLLKKHFMWHSSVS